MERMEIRRAVAADVPEIVGIYHKARAFMRQSGNPRQWNADYPNADTLLSDIGRRGSYACVADGKIVGTFFFVIAPEPTYAVIENGAWLNDAPYGVIHRVASDGSRKGVMREILDFCFGQIGNIRIDTHHDNTVMRQALVRYGFKPCGIIHLANGDERLAYQYARLP